MGAPRILFTIFLLLASSTAQQDSSNLFKVEGTVINSLTGRPLARALVQMSGRAVLTGSEGEFSFNGVYRGQTQISATKPGYFPPRAKPHQGSAGSTIEIGPDTGKIVLKLVPEAVVLGHVTGNDDEPLEGATIEVLALASVNSQTELQAAKQARTDEDGNYRLAGLVPARYAIAVKTESLVRRFPAIQSAKASEAYPLLVYHPQTGDPASATMIELSPGQRADVSFSLSLGPAFKVAGEWMQINPPVLVDSMDRTLLTSQFDAQSGSFEFRPVPAGTYRLRCSGLDPERRYEYSERTLTVSQPVTNLKLLLKRSPGIPVEFRTELRQPRSSGPCTYNVSGEIRQSDCSDMPPAFVQLIRVGSSHQFSLEWRPAKDSSGFAISGVPPGKYVVHAWPSGPGYVQSQRSGNLDLLREELVVPEEGTVAPIEVVLRDDPATLQVQVRGAAVGQQATVLVIPDARFSKPLAIGTSMAKIEAGPLPPGDYLVLAVDSVDGLDYANREALTPYLGKAATVTVSANQNASVAVDLIRTGE